MTDRTRRFVIWGLAALGIIVFALWAFVPRPERVDLALVEKGALVVTLAEEGETRVRDRFLVSAPVSGTLLRVDLEPGDGVVAAETVVATLRPQQATPLDARSVAQIEAEVRTREAELRQARHDQERAAAEVDFARRECDRSRALAEHAVVSLETLELAELEARRASESMSARTEAVVAAEHRLAAARARLLDVEDSAAPHDAPQKIRSPIDGVVLKRLRESESVVAAGEPLLEIGDPRQLEVVADYLSRDAVRIRPGARALIGRWGGEGSIEARVRRVDPAGFTKTSALGVEEQRVNVVLDLVTPFAERQGLGDGYRVEVRVVVSECDDVLRVPMGALSRRGEGWGVFVASNGRAVLREVRVGARTAKAVEILDGLEEGESVIIYPDEKISHGVRVEQRVDFD